MECGSVSDATSMPPQRHSGLYLDGGGALVLRLQRRRHRSCGSLMSRKCLCRAHGSSRCPTHRLSTVLSQFRAGQRLWNWTAPEFARLVKRLLFLLMTPGAERFTLKAFRAGKATELAKSGATLSAVLAAGEWKSSAFTKYVDEDAVDSATVACMVADCSDGE